MDNSVFLWELFLDTGAPEIYLLYRKSLESVQARTA